MRVRCVNALFNWIGVPAGYEAIGEDLRPQLEKLPAIFGEQNPSYPTCPLAEVLEDHGNVHSISGNERRRIDAFGRVSHRCGLRLPEQPEQGRWRMNGGFDSKIRKKLRPYSQISLQEEKCMQSMEEDYMQQETPDSDLSVSAPFSPEPNSIAPC